MRGKQGFVVVCVCVLALAAAGSAGGSSGMFVGVAEDSMKWRAAQAVAVARDLGMKSFRLTLQWTAPQTDLLTWDAEQLGSAVGGAGGMRIVLAVYGKSGPAPADDAAREQFCTYVRNVLARFPQINDVVIWNEPNLIGFWRPQFNRDGSSAAPAAYTALLARCYDVLHTFRPSVNVVAPATSLWGNDNPNGFDNIGHSPPVFIRGMGSAYRASGRTKRLFDTVGHHPYPGSSSERPWRKHPNDKQISMGDWDRLMQSLIDAFGGTGQPVPGQGVSIWYLETGYQTTIDESKRSLYSGNENWPSPVPDFAGGEPDDALVSSESQAPDQATQMRDSLRLAFCQPYVEAVFNFLLWDEPRLEGWQSAPLWVDGTRKDSYGAFQQAIADVNAGAIDCSKLKGGAEALAAAGIGSAAGANGGPNRGPAGGKSVTRVSYLGGSSVPFGFLKLTAQVTRGAQFTSEWLTGRTVTFLLDGEAMIATTNYTGIAELRPMPQPAPGKHRLVVRFHGDSGHLGSALRRTITVRNSRGALRTVGTLRLAGKGSATFRVSSNGRSVKGRFRFVTGKRVLVAKKLTALGISGNRRAWFAGLGGKGERFVVYVETGLGSRKDVFKLWLGPRLYNTKGKVAAGDLRIAPAKG